MGCQNSKESNDP
jgi:hypothetical protein